MNIKIVAVIVAIIAVVIALFLLIPPPPPPIVAADFSGEWNHELVIVYQDGTTYSIKDTSPATLLHRGSAINGMICYLFIDPTNNEGGTFNTLSLDFRDSDFKVMYNIISPTGVSEFNTNVPLKGNNGWLDDYGPINFLMDAGSQSIAWSGLPEDVLDDFILQEDGDYIMEIYYTGSVEYELDNGATKSLPSPEGKLILDFSRSLTAGIVDYKWES